MGPHRRPTPAPPVDVDPAEVTPPLQFPHYKDLEPDVKARFGRIYQRPVVMDVRGLCKTFETAKGPVEVLRDVNFKVHRREFICVLGASGCGKSTLIRI